eukprot:4400692-Amphidinium_carterae.1
MLVLSTSANNNSCTHTHTRLVTLPSLAAARKPMVALQGPATGPQNQSRKLYPQDVAELVPQVIV